MTVVGIKNITRKDIPLYYRRVFSGTAVLDIQDRQYERRIEFVIEIQPTGSKAISVDLLESLEYPLVPILSDIRDQVAIMDKTGSLP